MNFNELKINPKIIENVTRIGYQTLTKIQEAIIPLLLQKKCDIFACAQTGTGKTAAYALPMIDHLIKQRQRELKPRKPQCLVVAPTRELAIQIHRNFLLYSDQMDFNVGLYYGGIKLAQQLKTNQVNNDAIVATPGRLLELQRSKLIDLSDVKTFVVDEADHMLDMGFIDDLNKILSLLVAKEQILLFSATLSNEIKHFVQKKMNFPKFINANEPNSASQLINQMVFKVKPQDRLASLMALMQKRLGEKILIFTQTKKEANFLAKVFRHFKFKSNVIHSDKHQELRQKIIDGFQRDSLDILIATDVISRGLHINGIDLVVNYHLPKNPEAYIHRIGRTGRAGRRGQSVSFYTLAEKPSLVSIEKLMKVSIAQNSNLLNETEITLEKEKLKTFLINKPPKVRQAKLNQKPRRLLTYKVKKESLAPRQPNRKIMGKRIRFALHNHLRQNLQRQHQIHTSLKKNKHDNW